MDRTFGFPFLPPFVMDARVSLGVTGWMKKAEVEVRCMSFHSFGHHPFVHLLCPIKRSVITYANQVFIHAINLLQPIISISW